MTVLYSANSAFERAATAVRHRKTRRFRSRDAPVAETYHQQKRTGGETGISETGTCPFKPSVMYRKERVEEGLIAKSRSRQDLGTQVRKGEKFALSVFWKIFDKSAAKGD